MEPRKLRRLQFISQRSGAILASFADAVRDGLVPPAKSAKSLPCRFFYDADGSRLFEEICGLAEYYPTRAERCILAQYAGEIAQRFDSAPNLVELGSGSAEKSELLIDALMARHGRVTYMPIDISRSALESSAARLLEDRPDLDVVAVEAEYEAGLERIHKDRSEPLLVAWLGSSIGNFSRENAATFVGQLASQLDRRDRLLLGVDLRKDRTVLERAYDDGRGVTARFNLNLLARINRELGGEFDLGSFRHRASYLEGEGRIEMSLESTCDQIVRIEKLDLEVSFIEGERIHTEDSVKYSPDEIDTLARASGMTVDARWLDPRGLFSVSWLARQ